VADFHIFCDAPGALLQLSNIYVLSICLVQCPLMLLTRCPLMRLAFEHIFSFYMFSAVSVDASNSQPHLVASFLQCPWSATAFELFQAGVSPLLRCMGRSVHNTHTHTHAPCIHIRIHVHVHTCIHIDIYLSMCTCMVIWHAHTRTHAQNTRVLLLECTLRAPGLVFRV
jgi:hypothetical protein